MKLLICVLALLRAAAAKPTQPTKIIIEKNLIDSALVDKFAKHHTFLNDASLSPKSAKDQSSSEYAASPYSHHGHLGLFSHFWYPPILSLPASILFPALPATPTPAPAPTSPSNQDFAVTPVTPLVPIAAQIVGELFWTPLQNLIINVQQALLQPQKIDDTNY